ncbi:MAG: GNAT family N-acetyltransferase [Bacteroidetes bacterium]|nr:GNAT family N-acetyltransferase [Bacteroidota bacterium]
MHRLATRADEPALLALMESAIAVLQQGFLDAGQIASSRAIMGLDTQLIEDGTYYVIEDGDAIVGCGGWSPRATAYGGNHSTRRDATMLNPRTEPARIRAMYTHPDHARRGIGSMILRICENAARQQGFGRVILVATLSGQPLYAARGYIEEERFTDDRGGAPVPLVRMSKTL